VQNTVKEQQMDLALVFYVPIPDIKEYNMYGDEDLFLHEAIPGHFQIYNRKTNLYLISENTIGLPMVKDGPIHRKFRQRIRPIYRPIFWYVRK
jgi:hypothetical protein